MIPAAQQGWDQAVFTCGRCGRRLTTTTEDEHVYATSLHQAAHAVVDCMSAALKQEAHAVLTHDLTAPPR